MQLYAFNCVRAVSSWFLQIFARVARVAGVSASFFHEVRQFARACWYCAREDSGTFVDTQLS